jgi:hypothetical protein
VVSIGSLSRKTYGAAPKEGESRNCRRTFGVDSLPQIYIFQR